MSKRLGGIKGCKYKTSFMAFARVKISLLGCVWNIFKENQNAPSPSEHPPVRGKKSGYAQTQIKLLPSCLIVIPLLGCVWNIFNV